MNRASFALAMCAAVGPVAGQGDEAPQLEAPAVRTVFRLSATRLQATNPSSNPRLLLFSDAHGVMASAMLPAGGELDTELLPGALRGVTLESFTLRDGAIEAGASFGLDLPQQSGVLVIEERSEGLAAWLETHAGKQPVQSLGGQPTTYGPFGPAPVILNATAAPMPLHVPINTPDGTPKKDEPPVLDEEPLPPV